jgi:hypothetical protein
VNPPVMAVSAPPPVVTQQKPEPAKESPPTPAPPAPNETRISPAVVKDAPIAAINPPGTTPVLMIAMAGLLLIIALGLAMFLVRRSRRGPQQPSLISQSIDRPR